MKKTLLLIPILSALLVTSPGLAAKKHKVATLPPLISSKINLVWQAKVSGSEADFNQQPKLAGINVVSPCWFDISTARGLIKDKVTDTDYVANMHAKGYKVWPLITNSFNPGLTSLLLNSPEGQENLKENMLLLANKYKFDGYNLDFENIADSDRDKLTLLVKDLATLLKANNLTVSMDITTPSDTPFWSRCYDRGGLAKELDYVMLMAYDQHHPTMHQAGSTAGLDWVEHGLLNTLKDIPSEKLILGLPLYSRIWESKIGATYAQGKTISMPAMEKLIADKKIEPSWNGELGQNYLSYIEGNKLYQVWQENAASLTAKVKLVEKYKLAGIASWRKGFETPDVWPALNQALYPIVQDGINAQSAQTVPQSNQADSLQVSKDVSLSK